MAQALAFDWLLQLMERPAEQPLSVLFAGPRPATPLFDFAAAGREAAGIEIADWAIEDFPFESPWQGAREEAFDVLVLAGLLDRLADPQPFLRYLRQLAPLVIVEHERAADPLLRAALADGEYRVQEVPASLAGGRPAVIGHRDFDFGRRREPILVHVHIPKCAGTSVSRMLEAAHGPLHHNFYPQGPDFTPSNDQLTRVLANEPATKSIASHSIRVFPPVIDGRSAVYVCFLRDPLEQFVSYTSYIKKNFDSLRPAHKMLLPPDLDRISLRESARQIMTAERPVPFAANFATWFLTAAAFRRGLPNNLDAAARAKADALYRRIDLQMALDTLSNFILVGLSDRMADSIALLRHAVKPYGLNLDQVAAGHENVSKDYVDDTSWLTPDDEVGAMVLRSVEKDRQLYAAMRRRFDSALRAAGLAKDG